MPDRIVYLEDVCPAVRRVCDGQAAVGRLLLLHCPSLHRKGNLPSDTSTLRHQTLAFEVTAWMKPSLGLRWTFSKSSNGMPDLTSWTFFLLDKVEMKAAGNLIRGNFSGQVITLMNFRAMFTAPN